MNPKSKKIMTVGLALSAVGIWIPQLLMGVVDRTPTKRADVPNGDAKFEAAIMPGEAAMPTHDAAAETRFMTDPGMEAAMPEGGEVELSLPVALTMASKQLEIRNAQEKRVDLSDLLNAFRPKAKEAEEPSRESLQQELRQVYIEERKSAPSEELVPAISDADVLSQYCSQQVLSAVIWGEHESIAMINGQVVRPGDAIGNGVKVYSIDRRSVELSYRGEVQAIGMPAFEARKPRSSSSTVEGSSSEPEASPGEQAGNADPTLSELAAEEAASAPVAETKSDDSLESGVEANE